MAGCRRTKGMRPRERVETLKRIRIRSTAPENDRMTVRIAIVGDLDPAKHSHRELEAARSSWAPTSRPPGWRPTARPWPGSRPAPRHTTGVDRPGSPYADDAAVPLRHPVRRESGLPLLGTCGGMQYAVVEFVRDVLGRSGRTPRSTAWVPTTRSARSRARSWVSSGSSRRCLARGSRRCSVGRRSRACTTVLRTDRGDPVHPPAARLGRRGDRARRACGGAQLRAPSVLRPDPLPAPDRAIQWGRVHPILHAFVDLARRVAPCAPRRSRRSSSPPRRPGHAPVHQMRGPRHRDGGRSSRSSSSSSSPCCSWAR